MILTAIVMGAVFSGVSFSSEKATAAGMVSGSIGATPNTINKGESATLQWNSFNATYVAITPGIGTVSSSGEITVRPTQTTTYTLNISNDTSATTARATVHVIVEEEEETCRDRDAINYGGSLPCRYDTPKCTDRNATNYGGSLPCRYPTDVCPNIAGTQTSVPSGMHKDNNGNCVADTTPTDVCPNIQGIQTSVPSGMYKDNSGNCVPNQQSGNAPTVDLTADDTRIDEGDETTVRWTTGNNPTSCVASQGRNGWAGSKNPNGGSFDTDDLNRDTTYEITCSNQYGSDSDTVTVRVEEDDDDDDNICWNKNALNYGSRLPCRYYTPTAQPSLPTVVIYADQTLVSYRGATNVRWSTVNANYCTASGGTTGWAGPKSTGPGSFYTGAMTSARTFNITCYNTAGSDTDSVTVSVRSAPVTPRPNPPVSTGSSLVVITSNIDRNQPIVPTLDNTNPRPGDEITYTVTYQNVGTGTIRNLVLRLDLPYEVDYLYSTPPNPQRSGNTLIFSQGSLGPNQSGTVTVRVRVRQDAPPGALLNFPATLSYTDPAGYPQSVSANVSARVWYEGQGDVIIEEEVSRDGTSLAASVFGAGFWPDSLFGWLLLLILVLILIALVRYLIAGAAAEPFARRTSTTTVEHH